MTVCVFELRRSVCLLKGFTIFNFVKDQVGPKNFQLGLGLSKVLIVPSNNVSFELNPTWIQSIKNKINYLLLFFIYLFLSFSFYVDEILNTFKTRVHDLYVDG